MGEVVMFVRLAMPEDEDEFVDLARLAAAESSRHVGFSEAKTRETYARYLATAHPTFFVVEENHHIIGLMECFISEYDFADGIFTTQQVLFVHPDRRGTRASALLLRHLVHWSTQLGAKEITGGNDNAINSDLTKKLLGRFGFEQVGYFMRRIVSAEDAGQEGRD